MCSLLPSIKWPHIPTCGGCLPTHQIFTFGQKTFLQTDAGMCINISSWYHREMEPHSVLQWPFFKMIGCIVGSGNKLRVQQSATGGTSAPLSWYFLHYPMCLKSCCAPHMLFFFLFFFTPTDLLPSSLMFHKRWAEIKSLFESAPISLPPTYPFCANFSHSHHSVAVWRAGGKR